MEAQQNEIVRQQKETWNKFSRGWKKWDDLVMEFSKPMGEKIIDALALTHDSFVLDIASGTGEPALSIAARLKTGRVIATDISEGMLEVADEHAHKRGIKNFETQLADVFDLPFSDNTFDAVSCRFGFMFFPDMKAALREIVRVLKPGGRIATTVWGPPEKNPWISAMMAALGKNMELPAPLPDTPSIFRCAPEGMMEELFKQSGLKKVNATEVSSELKIGTFDNYWTLMNEVAAPVVAAMEKADTATKSKIRQDLYDLITARQTDGHIKFTGTAILISGEK